VLQRQERHRSLRPNEVRDAGEVVLPARWIVARQAQLILEDRPLLVGAPLVALWHARLHDAEAHVVEHGRRAGG
jgi:hypothetical protein